ncbi:MAG TPA: U32 family peptidase, partial [Bacteroidales bacterium]|nr:U32 family peptidase [Bacteroidales bacterium]
MSQRIEIMAPAGSWESVRAAAKGGAGSVYFGVGRLNMRSRSSQNFSIDDLKEIASFCREVGMKSYVTLNTIVYDHELDEMRKVANACKEAGVSAIIASDLSVLQYVSSIKQE